MRRFFSVLLLTALFALTLPQTVSALSLLDKNKVGDNAPLVAGKAGFAAATPNTLTELVGTIINAVLGLLGVLFLGLIIYGGFEWLTAQGNEEKVESAKKIITQATIGLAIVLGAYVITKFVVGALVAKTLTQ